MMEFLEEISGSFTTDGQAHSTKVMQIESVCLGKVEEARNLSAGLVAKCSASWNVYAREQEVIFTFVHQTLHWRM